ncbi:hypothetical protein [Mesoplasma lactucae]|uniref:Uncharacterized protein n=1 Tax=Mesoplasma lactucae ATCC 49193 TaxID=81460 RepID=A0A291IRC0_9MOLU|nr:hypothetical protein [Mesoplasma lactucae]ATG97323.1 hypothetical protein CP520_00935 [Mesoplasma lactucae ATCC 49193]ATZ20226.1 hypothetical protein MLACT_v1c04050 [Mesoplasma lactucae ATCC 49193]MCL8216975.1 hypothetical protein [Mesoplasma lactucae ATCC 49193]
MYNKQDSIFWWTLEPYVKNNPEYKNLSLSEKTIIEQGFRLAYYGLFQYELYTGRELTYIEQAHIQEVSNYIIENYDALYKTVYKDLESPIDMTNPNHVKRFQDLLDTLVIPYINDYSFVTKDKLGLSNEVISTIEMQLCFKNRYDINTQKLDAEKELKDQQAANNNPYCVVKVDEETIKKEEFENWKPKFSQLYPFLVTVLIIDPTHPENICKNIKSVFTKDNLKQAYDSGRKLSDAELKHLESTIDMVENEEDLKSTLLAFTEDHWLNADIDTRFKMTFQLSKLTSIFFKDKMDETTMINHESDIYDLLKNYLSTILVCEDEKEEDIIDSTIPEVTQPTPEDVEKRKQFLYPISMRDFDVDDITNYYENMKKGKQISFSPVKLEDYINGIIYSISYLRLVKVMSQDCELLKNFFIERKRVALVNSLKLFKDDGDNHFENITDYPYNLDQIFLTSSILSNMIDESKDCKIEGNNYELNKQLETMLKVISMLVALDPRIVREMDYSIEQIIEYYLICLGPYKKTKLGFDKNDVKDLINVVKKINKKINKKDSNRENDYYSTLYLINKLIHFDKKID